MIVEVNRRVGKTRVFRSHERADLVGAICRHAVGI
jgi:hypothetical protein